jgi:hypothetical protein
MSLTLCTMCTHYNHSLNYTITTPSFSSLSCSTEVAPVIHRSYTVNRLTLERRELVNPSTAAVTILTCGIAGTAGPVCNLWVLIAPKDTVCQWVQVQ